MTGPWEVNGTEEYSDKIIILDGSLVVKGGGSLTLTNVTLNVSGGDITVEAGGSLVLNNSTINIGCYFNGEHRIDVYGAFNATNGSSISSFDKAFLLTIHEEASVYIANTSISKCGYYLQTWGDHVSNVSEGGLLVKSSNTAIIDCTFTYCYAGVTVTASGVSIENSLFQSCVYGVVASEGWVNLRGCRVVNCDYGIHLVSSQNTVEGCIVEHAEGGAALYGSSNLVSGCNFSRCKHAVTVYGDGNLVENNRASEADIGFTVGGEGNNVTGNVAEGCKHSFYVVVSENGTFTNNMVEGSMHGFLVVQSGRNLFAGNTVKGTYYGFYLVESGRATITGNEISNCKYGVFVWFSDAEIRDNTFTDNDVNVFTFSLQTILALLLTLTSWSNQVMLSQTAIMAPIFLAAFVVYLRAREHVKRGYKKLGAAGAFLFAATIILLPFCLTESEDAGFNVSLLLIVYFIQSAPPLISNIYPTPAAYFGYYYYIYYPPFMLSFPYVLVNSTIFTVSSLDFYS
ncbi:MAG: NosD domain-containing protein [Candidatus Jordarchaeales archaeon]